MIELILIAVAAVCVVMVLVCVLAMVGGFVFQSALNLRWLLAHVRGIERPRPWLAASRPRLSYNRLPVAAEVRARVMARDGFACVYCGAETDLTVDHVVPRVAGGSNDPGNLVTACRSCNSRKGPRGERGTHAQVRRSMLLLWRAERIASRNGRH